MHGMLKLKKEFKQTIINYYENACVEKMMVLFFKKDDLKYNILELIKPSRDDYKYIQKNYTGLKPMFLKKCIKKCVMSSYDGMLLIHNHRERILPLLSSNDRRANKKILGYINKNTNILFGSGVYANKRLTYVLENKYTLAQSLL